MYALINDIMEEKTLAKKLTVNWMLQLVLPKGNGGEIWESGRGTHKYKITEI